MKNLSAENVARTILESYVPLMGIPEKIVSDLGSENRAELMQQLCRVLSIEKRWTAPYNPKANSSVERNHRTMKATIAKYVKNNPECWHEMLGMAALAYNCSTNSRFGMSPFFVVTGRDPVIPWEAAYGVEMTKPYLEGAQYNYDLFYKIRKVWEVVDQATNSKMVATKGYYDRGSHVIEHKVGDWVLVRRVFKAGTLMRSFKNKWEGPFEITDKVSRYTYKLKEVDTGKIRVATHDRIRRYPKNTRRDTKAPVRGISEEQHVRIEDRLAEAAAPERQTDEEGSSEERPVTRSRSKLGAGKDSDRQEGGAVGDSPPSRTAKESDPARGPPPLPQSILASPITANGYGRLGETGKGPRVPATLAQKEAAEGSASPREESSPEGEPRVSRTRVAFKDTPRKMGRSMLQTPWDWNKVLAYRNQKGVARISRRPRSKEARGQKRSTEPGSSSDESGSPKGNDGSAANLYPSKRARSSSDGSETSAGVSSPRSSRLPKPTDSLELPKTVPHTEGAARASGPGNSHELSSQEILTTDDDLIDVTGVSGSPRDMMKDTPLWRRGRAERQGGVSLLRKASQQGTPFRYQGLRKVYLSEDESGSDDGREVLPIQADLVSPEENGPRTGGYRLKAPKAVQGERGTSSDREEGPCVTPFRSGPPASREQCSPATTGSPRDTGSKSNPSSKAFNSEDFDSEDFKTPPEGKVTPVREVIYRRKSKHRSKTPPVRHERTPPRRSQRQRAPRVELIIDPSKKSYA